MPLVIVTAGGTQTISQSENDTVLFAGLGTLNIAGTTAAPIAVTLSGIAGGLVADTIAISNATVTVAGVAGASALVRYQIGSGGTLNLASTVGALVGTSIAFTGPGSRLVLGNAVDLSVLSGITGFGPGNSIDVSSAASKLAYTDAPGANTGGVLTLQDAGGAVVRTVSLASGDYTAGNFALAPDGAGGTLVRYNTATGPVTTSPSTGDLPAGAVVTLSAALSDPVSILGGIPSLGLSGGGTATLNLGASTPTNLVFDYTVAPGQNTDDLAVTSVALNGASVLNLGGLGVDLSGLVGNPAGVLQIDTLLPGVLPIVTNPVTGDFGAGKLVTLTLPTTEAVGVTGGTPTLSLSGGGTATLNPAGSTPTSLAFTYTVLPGQNTDDLAVLGVNLNGATVADRAGNLADLSAAIGNPSGILRIDTLAPSIAGVTATPANGTLGTGSVVTLTLTPSEGVVVVGIPTLSLNDGGVAAFDPLNSTPTSLVFQYTVQPGQDTADLAITGVNLAGATIADGAGNLADLSLAIGNPAGILQVSTSYTPFTAVSVSTDDPAMVVTVAAAVRPGTQGTYGNLGGGAVGSDGVTYSVTGTAAQVDAALAGVRFSPAGGAPAQTGVTAALGSPIGSGARLASGAGNDVLSANTGLTGGAGADTLIGGPGFDLAYYDAAPAAVTASLLTGGTLGDAAGDVFSNVDGLVGSNFDDSFQGDGNINLLAGGFGNDTLDGGGANDALFGQQGNDLLLGGDGNDLLRGGEGADTIDGGTGFNLAIYDTASAGVGVHLDATALNTGEAAGDTFVNVQGFLGSSFADVLVGDDTSNLLLGGDGNDTLTGGVGYDVMDAGAGNNLFLFDANFQFDHIGGFQAGPASGAHDVLSFSSQVFQSAAAAKAAVFTDPNGDAYVYAGGSNIVVLVGVSASQLTLDNFAIR